MGWLVDYYEKSCSRPGAAFLKRLRHQLSDLDVDGWQVVVVGLVYGRPSLAYMDGITRYVAFVFSFVDFTKVLEREQYWDSSEVVKCCFTSQSNVDICNSVT